MTETAPCSKWSTLNEVVVIEVMLMDVHSEHWNTCKAYIQYVITSKFPNLLAQAQNDAIQDAMLSVYKNLSAFRQDCKFTSWLTTVARNHAIIGIRRQKKILESEIYIGDSSERPEGTIERLMVHTPKTPEEIALTKERVRETHIAIEEFLKLHDTEYNRKILNMVLIDGNSYEKTAQALGIPAPNIGYIIRLAREYLRQKLANIPETDE